ncbi:phage recombination protein Bet [Salmonella enterica subsp. enterica]|uniref:phage recombination protein Bet n=1 Tax=Salmonella enterica TaxID=28901 RepID=UPI00070A8B60|nr:phage recombination protein Bet [Salmonella enterica]ECI2269393.1 phage recombination protein Bet [Salmonella enterica subsp. enterica]EDB6683484.1 phage recombination protein Bet [Salmonella enterica subsp. enterica serovar Infantis]EDR2589475.1 phage recombination protein Bet [Salmonella enterica subsp. enterica serovar Lexington]EAP8942222.1 phage recombination protein Bet [Salmonella enterica]EAV6583801.1 phage recombination protein Bet [Salmonella enterica]
MSNEIAITNDVLAIRGIDEVTWSALKNSIYPGAKDESVMMAVDYCRARQLDPLLKPVHLVPMSVKDSKSGKNEWRDVVMPGIGLYRIQADRSGDYAGANEPEFGPDVTQTLSGVEVTFPKWCKYTVSKRMASGEIVEFSAKEYWIENYATGGRDTSAPNAMWKKRPYAQLAKCAEAQALRKAWPEIGQQATAEEMEGKYIDSPDIIERDVTPRSQVKHGTASSMNSLINSKPEQKEPARNEGRAPDEILKSFTDAASNAESVEKLDLIFNGGTWPDSKKRPGAKDALSGKWLEMATDVYNVRRDELNEVPM